LLPERLDGRFARPVAAPPDRAGSDRQGAGRADPGCARVAGPLAVSAARGTGAERRLALLLCAPAAAFMLVVAAFPIVYALWLSLHRADMRAPDQTAFIGFGNYITVLSSPIWWVAFGVTLFVTVVSTLLELILGMALALVMHRTIVA